MCKDSNDSVARQPNLSTVPQARRHASRDRARAGLADPAGREVHAQAPQGSLRHAVCHRPRACLADAAVVEIKVQAAQRLRHTLRHLGYDELSSSP